MEVALHRFVPQRHLEPVEACQLHLPEIINRLDLAVGERLVDVVLQVAAGLVGRSYRGPARRR